MKNKIFFAVVAALGFSTAAIASDGVITVLNYSNNPIEIRVYDSSVTKVADITMMVNDKATGHWFTPASSWMSNDTFDSIHVFYVDKTTGTTLHCGDIPGGDPIPWGKTLLRTYEIDECGQSGTTLKWHPV